MQQYSLLVLLSFTAVVGVGSVTSFFLRSNDTSCACKNWMQVYQKGDVSCGAGNEFWQRTNTSSQPLYNMLKDTEKEMVCALFWRMIDSDRCININVGKDEGTWCYVDSACKTLQGGAKISDHISWKKCSTSDLHFRDYTPEELYNFSKQQDLDFDGLQKVAYPGSRAGERQVENSNEFENEIPTSVALKLKEFDNSDKPYWFDTNDTADLPYAIVHGSKVYKVYRGPALDFQHPATWAILNCTLGC